ncbi:MAG TPA: DUF5723 family protein [Salinimicrobium sp.]|nr:DUF5723 family protein [Salinimicrobium sp.]
MRKILFIFLFFSGEMVFAQNKQLLYNFDGLPQNLMSNPGGETDFDMNFGLPLFSGIHFSAGSTGVTFYDVFKTEGGTVNDNIREALGNLTNQDFFTVNQQLELVFFGWRGKNSRYFSGGIYQEMDAILYFPKDPAILAYEGNKDHISKTFDFSDLAFSAEVLNVFHFGFTNYYSEDLNYGARAKIYSSIFNAYSVDNRGSFRTIPSPAAPNLYRHFVNMDVMVKTAGYASLIDDGTTARQKISQVGSRAFLGGNLGLGLDLGFSYYMNDQTRFTGSVIDIGFIYQNKDVENYHYYGDYVTDGIELGFPNGPSPPYWDIWEDDLDKHLKDETLFDSYVTWRPVKFNASVDFGFNENMTPCNCHKPSGRREYYNHISFHLFSMKRPKDFVHAATLSFDKTFSENFRGKITYTADSFSFTNIGLLFSSTFNGFNFYLAADNLLSYINLAKAHNASIQLGFQLLINRE